MRCRRRSCNRPGFALGALLVEASRGRSGRCARAGGNTLFPARGAFPLNQRFLIDYAGRVARGNEPMSTPDFKPLLD